MVYVSRAGAHTVPRCLGGRHADGPQAPREVSLADALWKQVVDMDNAPADSDSFVRLVTQCLQRERHLLVDQLEAYVCATAPTT